MNITHWQIVGVIGSLMFGARWIVQALASHRKGKSHVPKLFWYMSITGNILLLSYFIFGRLDSVGILSNAFPFLIALYNLMLLKNERPESTSN